MEAHLFDVIAQIQWQKFLIVGLGLLRGLPQSSLQLTQSKSEASTFHAAHTSSKKLGLRYNVNTSAASSPTA